MLSYFLVTFLKSFDSIIEYIAMDVPQCSALSRDNKKNNIDKYQLVIKLSQS